MRIKRPGLFYFDKTGLSKQTVFSLKLMFVTTAISTVFGNTINGVAKVNYLRSLNVTDFVYGLIMAIGPIGAAVQIFAAYIVEKTRKRKLVFMISGIMHRVAYLPFGLVPFFFPMTDETLLIWLAVLMIMVAALCAPFVNVTFLSYIAEVVPVRIRGGYFGVRTRIATVCVIAAGLATAYILDRFTGFGGYALVFTTVAVLGIIDISLFALIPFPPMPEAETKPTLIKMLADVFKNRRYMNFIIFTSIAGLVTAMSAVFQMVYARGTLGLSNMAVTVAMQIVPNVCMIITLPMWGRALDRYGNRPVMLISAYMTCLNPFLWFFLSPGPYAAIPILVVSTFGGLAMSGMTIGTLNISIGHAPEKNRSMFISLYLCVTTILAGLGGPISGWLLDNVMASLEGMGLMLFGSVIDRYNYVFGVSAVLHLLVIIILLPRMITEENTASARAVLAKVLKSIRSREVVG